MRHCPAKLSQQPPLVLAEANRSDDLEYGFEVYEVRGDERMQVASGSGPDQETAIREANHYAAQYAQDGPVEVFLTTRWPLSQAEGSSRKEKT